MKPNPFLSFVKANVYLAAGRLHFPKARIGELVQVEDGATVTTFTIFRELIIKPPRLGWDEEHGARFKARFHVEKMSPKKNKVFSLLTIPFFIGLKGFRSKIWLQDEKGGDAMGIYEWQTVDDARNYSESFAVRFMTKRSVEGSTSFTIDSII